MDLLWKKRRGGRSLPKDHLPLKVPTAIAKFPKEYLEWAPRSYVERIYNVKQWTNMPAGGHFAALEKPDLLIKDIRGLRKNYNEKYKYLQLILLSIILLSTVIAVGIEIRTMYINQSVTLADLL